MTNDNQWKAAHDRMEAHASRLASLVAHVLEQFDKMEQGEPLEEGEEDSLLWEAKARAALQEPLVTNLAEIKAKCWHEAYMAGMEHGHHWTVEGGYVSNDSEAADEYVAEKLAEEY